MNRKPNKTDIEQILHDVYKTDAPSSAFKRMLNLAIHDKIAEKQARQIKYLVSFANLVALMVIVLLFNYATFNAFPSQGNIEATVSLTTVPTETQQLTSIPWTTHTVLLPSGDLEVEQVYVSVGTFEMGGTHELDTEYPYQLSVESFWLDKNEVTNELYANFLNTIVDHNSGCSTHRCIVIDRDSQIELENGRFDVVNGYDQHPVMAVTWHGAVEYCEWLGGRLPTEAEWEYAASGTANFTYPWGNEFNASNANSAENGSTGTRAVGSYPNGVSPFGALDMAGNVWEWTQSDYSDYQVTAGGESTIKVLKGGAWNLNRNSLRTSNRYRLPYPTGQAIAVGFRCVQDVLP